jgi:hypothetical protein
VAVSWLRYAESGVRLSRSETGEVRETESYLQQGNYLGTPPRSGP